jgi:ABC-type lipoprotein release transport system permease subunit
MAWYKLYTFFHYFFLIIWFFFCVGIITKGQSVCFYLPELKKFFELEIGDVMLIKASLIQHSIRTYGSIGQFGMCLYMQASFFPMWRAVQEDLRHMHNDKKLSEDKLKKINHWLTNHAEYIHNL